jgi:release factor glutamine methyltransferase
LEIDNPVNTVQGLYLKGKSLLKDVADPSLEAKLLTLMSLGISEESFYSYPEKKVSESPRLKFLRLVSKRREGIPLAYLLEEKEFWSIRFKVSPGVLIPRPETELLVEKVIELSSKGKEVFVDIGTGAGNIAVSLAKELPQASIVATDVNQEALKLAKTNARLQKVSSIGFLKGSLFNPVKKLGFQKKCDFVVSNPPYVSEKEWDTLPDEIINHEPKTALVPGKTGLEFIKRLIRQSPDFLKSSGYLCFEMGFGQMEKILPLFGDAWHEPQCFDELNGIPRVVTARLL